MFSHLPCRSGIFLAGILMMNQYGLAAEAQWAQVPNTIGMAAREAKAAVEAAGLVPEFHLGPAAPAAGMTLTVSECTPPVSTRLKAGSSVRITVYANEVAPAASQPIAEGSVPALLGLSSEQVRETMDRLGYAVQFYLGPPPTSPEYALTAYSQQPVAGTKLEPGKTVHVDLYTPPGTAAVGLSAPVTSQPLPTPPVPDAGPSLLGVSARPYLDESSERIVPRSGLLSVEQLDMQVAAGPVVLEVRRYLQLDPGEPGLLGRQWRLNWEKRLFQHDAEAAILEKEGWLVFRPHEGAGRFLSAQGDILVRGESSSQCFRADSTTETYDAHGKLTQIDARNGNLIRLEYDAADRLTRVQGPLGSYLSLISDQSGRLVQVGASNGAIVHYSFGLPGDPPQMTRVRFGYNDAGRLSEVVHPRTGRTEYQYDADGRVIARRFADGAMESWEYDEAAGTRRHMDASGNRSLDRIDPQGRSVELETPLGHRSHIELDDWGRPATIIGPDGRKTQLTFDDLGRLTELNRESVGTQKFEYFQDTPVVTASLDLDGSRVLRQYDLQRNLLAVAHPADREQDTQFEYFPNGLLKSIAHHGHKTLVLTYDDRGQISSVTDAAGNVATFEYDSYGHLLRWVDPLGHATTNSFDVDGRLISSADASGAATTFTYDDAGRVAGATDSSGGTTRYEYDPRGRRIARTDPLGRTWRWTYDANGRLTSDSDAAGAVTRYEYDADGNQVRRINALGGTTVATFDAMGRMVSQRDPGGGTTQFIYAAGGWLIRRTAPDGGTSEFEYDPADRLTAETDRFGRTTRYEYDLHGNLVNTVLPEGPKVTRQYDAADRLIAVLQDGQPLIRYEYDVLGNRTKEIFATGREVNYAYDAEGRVTSWHDNLGGSGSTRYDLNGRPLEVVDPSGGKVRYRYDLAGHMLGKTDPLGNSDRRTYDASGQLTSFTDPAGRRGSYEYDQAGRLVKVIRPGGGESLYQYDLLGDPIQATDPLGNVARSQYDSAGRLTAKTDALGQTTTFLHDTAGRIVEKHLADGKVISFHYDRAGNLEEADDGVFPIRYQYDDQGRRMRLEYPAIQRWMNYTYDSRGRLASIAESDGVKTEYVYDVHDRLSEIRSGEARTQLTYDAAGRRTGIAYPNGVKCTREFDAAGRITSLTYTSPDQQVLTSWNYSYDAAGQLTQAVAASGEKFQYRYDAAGQLVESRMGDQATQYAYGPGGSREGRKRGDTTTTYTSDAADRLVSAGEERFTYDDNGSLVARKTGDHMTRYHFNAENRLSRVELPDGRQVTFGYAANGERIWREDESGRTWFVNDGLNLVAELNAQLQVQKRYLHGPGIDDILAMQQGEDLFCLHADVVGSIRWLTDASGRLTAARDFDAFGLPSDQMRVPDCRFAFSGREYDPAIGLYYYRARYYDPELGRFISPDPAVSTQDDLLSLNPYQYAHNSPANRRDPLGAADYANAVRADLAGLTPQQALDKLAQEQHFLREMLNNLARGIRGGTYYGDWPHLSDAAIDQQLRDDINQLKRLQESFDNLVKNPPPTPPVEPPAPPRTPPASGPSEGSLLANEPEPLRPTTTPEPTPTAPRAPGGDTVALQARSNNTMRVPAPETPGIPPAEGAPTLELPATGGGGGFGGNFWRTLKGGLNSRLGQAGLGVGTAIVAYQVYHAPPGHGANVAARGTGSILGSTLGGAFGVALLGSNPVGWAAILGAGALGVVGTLGGGVLGGTLGDWLVPAHSTAPPEHTLPPPGSSAAHGIGATADLISALEQNLKRRQPQPTGPPQSTMPEKQQPPAKPEVPPKQTQPTPPAQPPALPPQQNPPKPTWYFRGVPMYPPPGKK